MRRLTGDERIGLEFATTWQNHDLDAKTRTLLSYAQKLTLSPNQVGDEDIRALEEAGWDERGIYEASALIGFLNFAGRLEAASGLPHDQVPEGAPLPEATGS